MKPGHNVSFHCMLLPAGKERDGYIGLKDFRGDYTVISGLSHAGMSPGFAHQASVSFLTGVPGAGRPGFRNAISLDQFAAEKIGGLLSA